MTCFGCRERFIQMIHTTTCDCSILSVHVGPRNMTDSCSRGGCRNRHACTLNSVFGVTEIRYYSCFSLTLTKSIFIKHAQNWCVHAGFAYSNADYGVNRSPDYVPRDMGICGILALTCSKREFLNWAPIPETTESAALILELTVREVRMVLMVGILRESCRFHGNSCLLSQKNTLKFGIFFYCWRRHTCPSFWRPTERERPPHSSSSVSPSRPLPPFPVWI